MAALGPAPATLYTAAGDIADGHYSGAVADPALRLPAFLGSLRQKQWHYLSLATEHHLVALAVVQLRYVANCFVYVVDLRWPDQLWQTDGLSPFGLAARFAATSQRGATTWRSGQTSVTVMAAESGWQIDLDVALQGPNGQTRQLVGKAQLQADQAFSLIHRLPNGHSAYTRKDAGMAATVDLRFGEQQLVSVALATSDWTQSLAMRVTRWNWASLVTRLPDGRRLGCNLSAQVYDDAAGHGRENVVWRDGRMTVLGGVRFTLPEDPTQQPWQIASLDDGAVDLTFTPLGARRQNLDFGLVTSRFVQPYGRFAGNLVVSGEKIALDGAVGVVEDHLAKW